jgi:hypothetical protein
VGVTEREGGDHTEKRKLRYQNSSTKRTAKPAAKAFHPSSVMFLLLRMSSAVIDVFFCVAQKRKMSMVTEGDNRTGKRKRGHENGTHLQCLRNGLSSLITDLVPTQVQLFERRVLLQHQNHINDVGYREEERSNQQQKKKTAKHNTAHRNPLAQSGCSDIADLVVAEVQRQERPVILFGHKSKNQVGLPREGVVGNPKTKKEARAVFTLIPSARATAPASPMLSPLKSSCWGVWFCWLGQNKNEVEGEDNQQQKKANSQEATQLTAASQPELLLPQCY